MTRLAGASRVVAVVLLGGFWLLFWTDVAAPGAGSRLAWALAIAPLGVTLTLVTVPVAVWCLVRATSGAHALVWLCAGLVLFMVWSYSALTADGDAVDARFSAAMVLTWLALAAAFLGRSHVATQCYVRSPGVRTPGKRT